MTITTEKDSFSTEIFAFTTQKGAISDEKGTISDEEGAITTDKGKFTGRKGEFNGEKGEIAVEPVEVARNDDDFSDQEEEVLMSVTTAIKRSVTTLDTTGPVPALISSSTAIVARMTGNSAFPSPTPSLATVAAAIAELQTAETAASARTKGATTVRNDKRAALVTLLRQLESYVQNQADANLENGAALIESAGMAVRKTPARKPRTFTALAGPTSGSVKLIAASAAHRASYEWQYSTDGGKTWTFAPGTLQAKTTITALTPGASVQFKYRPVLKAGDGDWSQTVTIIVK